VPLNEETLSSYDLVLVSTDHDAVDYTFVAKHARLCIDTRNAFARAGIRSPHIVKA
jgi:UDP-N-acetyl-D-glucosamine dehydrogenase